MPTRIVFCLFLLLIAQDAAAGIIVPPTVRTVGTDAMVCDYTSLQDAIDDSGTGDTIRVQNLNWNVFASVSITNKSLTVVGGFTDCSDTTADPDSPTTLTMAGVNTVLTVGSAIAGVQNVLIRNFVLRLGDGGATKGGGVDLSGGVSLRLDNVVVTENQAQYGGGVRIHSGPPHPTLILEGGTRIGGTAPFTGNNNATQQGGGIYCDGGGLIEWKDASINYNTALGAGGFYLSQCDVSMPPFNGDELRVSEIRGNSSLNSGGGMTVLNGSTVNLSSTPNRLVQIIGNSAVFNGAGISATGVTLTFIGVQIEQNLAQQSGGGLYISDTVFSLSRGAADGSNCPQRPRCATIRRNIANTNSGGFAATNGSQVILSEVFLESNQAAGISAVLVNGGSSAVLRNVQVAGNVATNGAGTRLFFLNDGTLDIRHMTMALNQVHVGFEMGASSTLKVHDSIVWDETATLVLDDGTKTLDLSCNNALDTVTFPGAESHDPGFLSTSSRGVNLPILWLKPDSENVDRCDDNPITPLIDLYGSERVVDVSDVPNGAGPMDRGAYEYDPPVFADGYED